MIAVSFTLLLTRTTLLLKMLNVFLSNVQLSKVKHLFTPPKYSHLILMQISGSKRHVENLCMSTSISEVFNDCLFSGVLATCVSFVAFKGFILNIFTNMPIFAVRRLVTGCQCNAKRRERASLSSLHPVPPLESIILIFAQDFLCWTFLVFGSTVFKHYWMEKEYILSVKELGFVFQQSRWYNTAC